MIAPVLSNTLALRVSFAVFPNACSDPRLFGARNMQNKGTRILATHMLSFGGDLDLIVHF